MTSQDNLTESTDMKTVSNQQKFENWLTDEVGLPQYLSIFVDNEYNDIELLPHFYETDLINDLKIKKIHVKKIIQYCKEYELTRKDFIEFITQNNMIRYKNLFNSHNIYTMKDLKDTVLKYPNFLKKNISKNHINILYKEFDIKLENTNEENENDSDNDNNNDDNDDNSSNTLLLTCDDDLSNECEYRVSKDCLALSGYVSTILSVDQNVENVELKGVSSWSLKYIVEYLNHHRGIEPTYTDEFDFDFIDRFNLNELNDLKKSANYMDIGPLLMLINYAIRRLNNNNNNDNNENTNDNNNSNNDNYGMITLKSGGRRLTLPESACALSNYVSKQIQDGYTTEVDVGSVDIDVLGDIVEYLEHHDGVNPSYNIKSNKNIKEIVNNQWDISFITKFDNTKLYDLLFAANYMDIEPLFQLIGIQLSILETQNKDNKDDDNNNTDEEDDEDDSLILVSGGDERGEYKITRQQARLVGFISTLIENHPNIKRIECNQVGNGTLKNIVDYLKHHEGVEPPALPCPVRSIHMREIVTDQWDADFIDQFNKKQIFEIILGANWMGINCLLHLGSAKIATLIKQLDQQEINRIIEEEEDYRAKHGNRLNGGN